MESKRQKTVTLYESQIPIVQEFSNDNYDGDFSQGLRKIIKFWVENNIKTNGAPIQKNS